MNDDQRLVIDDHGVRPTQRPDSQMAIRSH
jgi:hypothetical protein